MPVIDGVLANGSAFALTASVKSPAGLAVDAAGDLYIADTGNNRILFLPNANGSLLVADAQTFGTGLSSPSAVALDPSGDLFIADTGNNAIEELAAPIGGTQVKVVTGLNAPSSLAADASGSLFVVDQGNANVYRYPNSGGTLGTRELVGDGISAPYALAIDSVGNLYVTDNVSALVDVVARIQVALQFGTQNVSVASSPLTATVSNSGNLPLIFPTPSYTASGSATAGFAITNDGCATAATVAAGGSCPITATFTPPVTELDAEEDLTLNSNASNGTPTIALIGTGAHITPSTITLALTSPAAGSGLTAGEAVTFTATIGTGSNTVSPGGTIKFFVNGSQVGTSAVKNAAATLSLPNGLPQGAAVVISATYSGDSINYTGASVSITEDVAALPTTLALTATTPFTNPSSANDNYANATGPSIPLTATLGYGASIIPGGTVTFYSGMTVLGTASVVATGGAYEATISTTALRAGTTNVVENDSFLSSYSITAVYSGDATYGPSTSNAAAVTIVGPPNSQTAPACSTAASPTCEVNLTGATFTISPTSASISIAASSGATTGSTTLTFTSYGGWTGNLTFTCTNLPAYATCNPYPGVAVVGLSTSSAPSPMSTEQFTITTNVAPVTPTASSFTYWAAGLSGLVLLVLRRRARKFGLDKLFTVAGAVLIMALSIFGMMGCSSDVTNSAFVTPQGTTNVTVTVHAAQFVAGSTVTNQLDDTNAGSFQVALTVK